MSNIETKTYIKGADASTMTDSQIFSRIAGIEQEIDKLKAIRTPSEKLAKTIAELEADVTALAAYVDGR